MKKVSFFFLSETYPEPWGWGEILAFNIFHSLTLTYFFSFIFLDSYKHPIHYNGRFAAHYYSLEMGPLSLIFIFSETNRVPDT